MFGYAIPKIKELSPPARERYYACYCGLCRALARRYGAAARLLLNYDTTLLTVMSGGEKSVCRCPYKLGKRYDCVSGEGADFAADATVLLSYLKFEDDRLDDRSARAAALMRAYRGADEKAKKRRPETEALIKERLYELSEMERDGENDPELPAQTFGKLLAALFAGCESFAQALGEAIYVTDAACDRKSDIKRKRYNPFVRFSAAQVDGIVSVYFARCERELAALTLDPITREIAESVVYGGLRMKYDIIKETRGL